MIFCSMDFRWATAEACLERRRMNLHLGRAWNWQQTISQTFPRTACYRRLTRIQWNSSWYIGFNRLRWWDWCTAVPVSLVGKGTHWKCESSGPCRLWWLLGRTKICGYGISVTFAIWCHYFCNISWAYQSGVQSSFWTDLQFRSI